MFARAAVTIALVVAAVAGVLILTEAPVDEPTLVAPGPAATSSTIGSTTLVPTLPPTTTTPPPTEDELVAQVLAGLSVEQKAGQLLAMQFSGSPDANVLNLVGSGTVGTVFLTSRSGNVTTIDATAALTGQLQDAAGGVGLLITTDQEGAPVQQVNSPGITVFPPAQRYGRLAESLGLDRAVALVEASYTAMGAELAALGFNVDLAPVADVNVVGNQGAIRNRSFSADPVIGAALTAAATRGLQAVGVGATAKHFPGHGPTAVDSHRQLPIIEKSREDWDATDRLAFDAAIAAGTELVMVGHLYVTGLDSADPRPATLSPEVITRLLRGDLGYDGVVITDDLAGMRPVQNLSVTDQVLGAIDAGADILLTPPDPAAAHQVIVDAVASGRISMERLDASAHRVLRLKMRLDLVNPPPPDSAATTAPPTTTPAAPLDPSAAVAAANGAAVLADVQAACTEAGFTC